MATVTGLTAAQTQALLDQKAALDHTHVFPVVSAYFDTTWPARPTADTSVTVLWIGGTEAEPPPAVPVVDVWIRGVV